MSVLTDDMKLVVFTLNGKEYAIQVKYVRSIEKLLPITRVPRVAEYIKGVINLRGVIIPIIDLRLRFQLPSIDYNEDTRILIISTNDKEIGLIVDAANDVMNISASDIEPQPEVIGNEHVSFIQGVIKKENRLLILLDMENVLVLQGDK